MKTNFKDHFSEKSQEYSLYRPKYPIELFSYLAEISTALDSIHTSTAWDCATGTGQSALGLSDYFATVIATDASQTQIDNAVPGKGVLYRVATAEDSGIESDSIDLVTVAQAFHWFDIDAFTKEVKRVLRDGGILAVWTYNLLSIKGENGEVIDSVVNHLYGTVLDDFWPEERRFVERGYKDIVLPFKELDTPVLKMSAEWNLSNLMGYLATWSAVKKYQKKNGVNPVEAVLEEVSKIWGEAEKMRLVEWPLSLRLWQK